MIIVFDDITSFIHCETKDLYLSDELDEKIWYQIFMYTIVGFEFVRSPLNNVVNYLIIVVKKVILSWAATF